jgi:mono/diheme cytochrome c family protein
MSRLAKILPLCGAAIAVAVVTAACGTEKISVPTSQKAAHAGAVLFSERCAGCHTLSYAATHGSAPNVRTAQANSGPNFDQRCERPIDRVLYAIENGGFSGAYMPQNIVVGQDAIDVAKFVATYAGRQAPRQTGIAVCQHKPLGTLPSSGAQPTATVAGSSTTASAATTGGSSTTAAAVATPASSATAVASVAHARAKRSAKRTARSSS